MTKTRNTKHTLIMSLLSLLVCISMLVSTTYAWLVDSVSSQNNTIVAGLFDIELEYKKVVDGIATDWQKIEGASDIFDPNALWEPGRVEVVYFKISNLGTLELKYQLGFSIRNEVTGTNVAGDSFRLSDHLVLKIIEMNDEFTTYNESEAVRAVEDAEKGLNDYKSSKKHLEPKSDDPAVNDEDYVAVIIYMPESVGYEANYRGNETPKIEFEISVVASQTNAANDLFGND